MSDKQRFVGKRYRASSVEKADAFAEKLRNRGLEATARFEAGGKGSGRGLAAYSNLYAKVEKKPFVITVTGVASTEKRLQRINERRIARGKPALGGQVGDKPGHPFRGNQYS